MSTFITQPILPCASVRLAVHVLFPNDHYALNEFWMWNESHYSFVSIHHDYRRADMRVLLVQPLDLVSFQLRVDRHDFRLLAPVRLHLARLRDVPASPALQCDLRA